MSFSISVHCVEDEPPAVPFPSGQDDEVGWQAFNTWMEEMWKITTYWPLGADGTVYDFWSTIAAELGLPMLAALYNEGLTADGPEQLLQLEREMEALQAYWHKHELYDSYTGSFIPAEKRQDLQESMGFLREAIDLARASGGVLSIS